QFTEKMKGFFSKRETEDFAQGEQQGKVDGESFEFVLTVGSDDLNAMLTQPEHAARMVGTAVAPTLSAAPLTVTDGAFHLFVKDPDAVETRLMRYEMKLTSQEGRVYHFQGFKRIHDDPGADVWSDTSTLYITIREGDSDASPVLGCGVLRI